MRRRWLACGATVVLAGTLCTGVERANAAPAPPIVVTTNADTGAGSLRQAILDANANSGTDSITFNIPGSGIHVITLATALPQITDPVSIDARTQPGWTNSPLVEVNQTPFQGTDTLILSTAATGSTIAGMAFVNFTTAISAGGSVTVDQDWIGLHADGTPGPGVQDSGANQGIGVEAHSGSAITRSVFTNIGFWAVSLCGDGGDISDNRIGVGPDGAPAVAGDYGIMVQTPCGTSVAPFATTHIGRPGHGNIVGGSKWVGIVAVGGDVAISDNMVGFAADGVTANPNLDGIDLQQSGQMTASITNNLVGFNQDLGIGARGTVTGNRIGVTATGGAAPNGSGVPNGAGIGVIGPASVSGNEVANNVGTGIGVNDPTLNISIRDNNIHDNTKLGIDLNLDGVTANDPGDADSGPNGLQNFPVITSITRSGPSLTIAGALDTKANVGVDIDLYQSQSCDPSGNGEGTQRRRTFHSTTPASGPLTWQTTFNADNANGAVWTATATTTDGTSEFSACRNAPTGVSCANPPAPQCVSVYAPEALVWRHGVFYVSAPLTGGATTATAFPFGDPTDRPISGRLQDAAASTVAVFRNGTWFVSNHNSSSLAFSFSFGSPGDVPVVGNWTGTGATVTPSQQHPGVFRNGQWFLRDSTTTGIADHVISYGSPGDIPVVGDWNGDGIDTIGVVRGTTWYLKNSNTSGFADVVVTLGDPGDKPVVADWDGRNNSSTPGVFRNGTWFFRNTAASGAADGVFLFGDPGDVPLTGTTS